MYLDFETYKVYGGTITDEATYTNTEYKTRMYIDLCTFDRLKVFTTIPEKIKRCMFDLIEFSYKSANSDKVSSFSNDGIRVNLANEKTDEQQSRDIVKAYLHNYMYKGADFIYPKEDIEYIEVE